MKLKKTGNYIASDFGLPISRMKRLQELELAVDDIDNTSSNEDEFLLFGSTDSTTLPDLDDYDSESW